MQKCGTCHKKTVKSDCLRNDDQRPVVQFDYCTNCHKVVKHRVYREEQFKEIGGLKGLEDAVNDGL